MKRSLEVADIFRALRPAYREIHDPQMPLRHLRVMRAVEICRTAELGSHIDQCDHCGQRKISYNLSESALSQMPVVGERAVAGGPEEGFAADFLFSLGVYSSRGTPAIGLEESEGSLQPSL